MAGSAFKDPEVVKALAYFTPILVDKDTEKDVIGKYAVGGIPDTRFADVKGEVVQKLVGAQQDPAAFLKVVQDMAKKIKAGHPSKEAAALKSAQTELDAAVAKKQIAAQFAAIAKLEKLNIAGDELDAAVALKKQLIEDGQKRLDADREAVKGDKKDDAVKDLRKLAQEYKGTDVGTQAAALLKQLEPPPGEKPK
jgi:hypothetical protein